MKEMMQKIEVLDEVLDTDENIKIEDNLEADKETCIVLEKKHFKIFGFTIWRILAYFIIYSILGYFIETLFCIARYGVLESRQSFLYGPFCSIYGIGAIFIIICLQYFKKNYNTIFLGGCIVGSVLEYIISWIGEMIFNVKWWDYSNVPLNINGRICLLYSIFWGALSLYLMVSLNPKVDKLINWFKKKLNNNVLKTMCIAVIIAMLIDCIITGYALMCFMVRTIKINNIEVKNMTKVENLYDRIYSNEKQANFIYKHFGDEKMLKTFPRLKIESSDDKVIYFSDILTDIQPYYWMIWQENE